MARVFPFKWEAELGPWRVHWEQVGVAIQLLPFLTGFLGTYWAGPQVSPIPQAAPAFGL